MPISQGQLAKHWGVSQPYIAKLVKLGLPMNSLRAATLWRKARGRRREANNTKSANLRSNRGRPKNPPKLPKLSKSGDSLRDALNNAIAAADAAYQRLDMALGNPMEEGPALSLHNHALDQRFKAETAYREEQERRNILVPKQEATELCRRSMEAMLKPLKRFATETGPQCVNKDAILIVKIMQRKVDEIIATGRKALHEL